MFPLDILVEICNFTLKIMFLNINIIREVKFKTVLIIGIIFVVFILLKCDKKENIPTQPEVEGKAISIDFVSYKLQGHSEKIPVPSSKCISCREDIDTLWGRLINCSINDVSQSEIELNFNSLGDLNAFMINDTIFAFTFLNHAIEPAFFPGQNNLNVSINVGYRVAKELCIRWDPFSFYVPTPSFADSILRIFPIAIEIAFQRNFIEVDSERVYLWVDDPLPETGYIDYSDFVSLTSDSSRWWTLYYEYSPGDLIEGKYKVRLQLHDKLDVYPRICNESYSFYVDTTGPDVRITLPDSGSVFSPRVQNSMAIVYVLSDNLEEYINKPKGGLVNVKIKNPSELIVWDTIIGANYYSWYQRIYWDFLDLNGDTCLTNGMYNIIVECEDAGENYGFSTLEFEIDVSPP